MQDTAEMFPFPSDCTANCTAQDTAEMYPVPTEASTQGSTDRYIGSWLKGRKRDSVVLASKVDGGWGTQGAQAGLHLWCSRRRWGEEALNKVLNGGGSIVKTGRCGVRVNPPFLVPPSPSPPSPGLWLQ